MISIITYILERLDLKNIPDAVCLADTPQEYEGEPRYKRYRYFGDCKTSVDKDHIWSTNEMSTWLRTCKVLDIDKVFDKISDGDRKIPKIFSKTLSELGNKIHDLSEVCCGIDDYQKIMFIYITDLDTHYFFDCE